MVSLSTKFMSLCAVYIGIWEKLVKLFTDFHFRGIPMSFSNPGITTQNTARDKMIKTCDAYVA